MPRKEQLQAMLADDPEDTFLKYGLAMELRKEPAEHEQGIALFTELMEATPPHVPAFFMCAQMLAESGDINQARTHLRNGIAVARSQGNTHAAGEMSELLTTLGAMGE
ncbi:MAG: hypothetical protein ACKVH8_10750 [Pirellulales bacterium]